MSDVFIFVLAIVFIGCASGVINNVLRNQRQQRELGGVDDSIVAEVSDLRARIEVLEKIVTDEKYHLSREIDRL
jgi:hypothetical protein